MNTTEALKVARKAIEAFDSYISKNNPSWHELGNLMADALPALSASASTNSAEQHYDDYAVDCFAELMKEKLRYSREVKGRGGWNDSNQCSVEYLNKLLLEHVAKGDPVDVANLCMMLAHYRAKIDAKPHERFDDWMKNPYTKVLQKSITEDYEPKTSAPQASDSSQPTHNNWHKVSDTAQRLAAELRGNVARKDFEAWAAEVLPILDKLTFMFCVASQPSAWNAAIEAAARAAENHSLAEQLARMTMANPVTHSLNLCRAVANAIRALRQQAPAVQEDEGWMHCNCCKVDFRKCDTTLPNWCPHCKAGDQYTFDGHSLSYPRIFKDGTAWCATAFDFINLQESPAGFGKTPTQAIDALLGYTYASNPAPAQTGEKK